MITRRSLLTLPPLIALTRAARAGSGYRAVEFDGDTYLANQGDNPKLPAESAQATVSFCFRVDPQPFLSEHVSWHILDAGIGGAIGANNSLSVQLNQPYDKEGPYFSISIQGTGTAFFAWAFVPDQIDGQWHHARATMDAAALTAQFAIGATALTTFNNKSQGPFADAVVKYPGRKIYVAGAPGFSKGEGGFFGGLGEIFLWPKALNVLDPRMYGNLWDARNGCPVRNDPSGQNAVPGSVPIVYLSGNASDFAANLPTSIGHWDAWSFHPKPDSPFTVEAGTLRTADSDPWHQPSATSERK